MHCFVFYPHKIYTNYVVRDCKYFRPKTKYVGFITIFRTLFIFLLFYKCILFFFCSRIITRVRDSRKFMLFDIFLCVLSYVKAAVLVFCCNLRILICFNYIRIRKQFSYTKYRTGTELGKG